MATNSTGRVNGADASFTTPGVPVVTTLPATVITVNSADLNGSVNPNGLATTAWLEWGLTTSYGNLTPIQPIPAGMSPVAVNKNITGLSSGSASCSRCGPTRKGWSSGSGTGSPSRQMGAVPLKVC